jgi:hypothetical protein
VRAPEHFQILLFETKKHLNVLYTSATMPESVISAVNGCVDFSIPKHLPQQAPRTADRFAAKGAEKRSPA